MRYLELMIDEARALSGNQRYDSNSGVQQRTFRQFFQNAQDIFVRAVILSKNKYFSERTIRTIVSGQAEYSYQTDGIMQGIDTIQWSANQRDWGQPLVKCIAKDQLSAQIGYPYGYIPNQDGYILNPPLASGYLLETYNRRPKRLEKRSAKVVSKTGTPITSITIDATYAGHDPTYLNQFSTISIVDRNGTPVTPSIPITSVSGTTINVSNYTLGSGESISAGDFVLAEGNSTNVPTYDDTVESFLILHATYQAKYGDASQWSKETKDDVKTHLEQIIGMLGSMSEDVNQIPIINDDYMFIS